MSAALHWFHGNPEIDTDLGVMWTAASDRARIGCRCRPRNKLKDVDPRLFFCISPTNHLDNQAQTELGA
jgi:hypothetical protein